MALRSDSNISIPDQTRTNLPHMHDPLNPEAHHHHVDNDVDSDEKLIMKKRVIVLGAGVEGLTTALKIKERWGAGVEVEIVADVFPTDSDHDPDSSSWNKGKEGLYTSWWAGAHYVSSAPIGTREADIAHATFQEMWALSEPGSESEKCFLHLEQTEFYSPPPPSAEEEKGEGEEGKEANPSPDPFERMPEFRALGQAATATSQTSDINGIPPFLRALGATHGYSFRTVTIDVPVYLRYLTDQLRKYKELENATGAGVRFVRGHVLHLGQVLEGGSDIFWRDGDSDSPSIQARNSTGTPTPTPTPSASASASASPPDAVIVCPGLGARFLGGVEDRDMYPSRGQTVILRAPWVRVGRSFEDAANGVWMYIIPRSGDVVVGGIEGVGDWYTKPLPETTRDLLERGLKLCPELVPPEVRQAKRGSVRELGEADDEITVNDIAGISIDDLIPLIVEEGCGLRPMRKGDARIELEWMDVPGPGSQAEGRGSRAGEAVAKQTAEKRKVGVIYNYGHGTRGYIQSIGSAKIVLGLLEEVFVNACA